ncbi:MAG: indolepyruvate ferredoxin oxidoreductase subunit alpha [Thermotogae bacterium]|nr:indolepyruvate ferredoxin oxidoreductase subunit alpha [Thermotogota bacterium]
MGRKTLLLGNEAIARGAWEAGVRVAVGYPGTPSTEVLETIGRHYKDDVRAQWSPNEKVAYEVALGASFAGARVLVTMKHVGLNVAADPFVNSSLVGAWGGLVVLSADDPNMYSSQNEQDNRYYAKFALVPMLEPSDPAEAKELIGEAFRISEEFQTPVLFRTTTRINHTVGVVPLGEREDVPLKGYRPDVEGRVLLPVNARKRRRWVLERLERLKEFSESFPYNRAEYNDTSIGIISSGVAYTYAREVFPNASFLKLTMTFPLPEGLIREFASRVRRLVVVEELEPFLEEQIRAMGIDVVGKEYVPRYGELSPQRLRKALAPLFALDLEEPSYEIPPVAPRFPAMCPGCPHTPIFWILRKMRAAVMGDIGCYTLGALPPIRTMESTVEMGSSIGTAIGMEMALGSPYAQPEKRRRPIVSVIGDSTFFHSGLTGVLDAIHNRHRGTIVVLNNSTTAMTGHQDHPGVPYKLDGEVANSVSIQEVLKAAGVKHVYTVDPYDLKGTEEVLRREVERDDLSVIVTNRPCVLKREVKRHHPEFVGVRVNPDKCTFCKLCLQVGCPSIYAEDGKAKVDELTCIGCGLCVEVCPYDAIEWIDPDAPNVKKFTLQDG